MQRPARTLRRPLPPSIARPASPFARDRARLHQARVYIKQGNKQKAIDMYKELLAKAGASSPIRDDIQNRLAALEP